MITIQPEREEHYTAIHEISALAFGRENEAKLVESLRKSAEFIPELSLVAIENGRVVGHILFSRVNIRAKTGSVPALGLAPMAVHPEFQNRGVGSELVDQGLAGCRTQGHRIVVVIGHPRYYPRFGFTSARARGLEVAFPVPDEAFMVLEIAPGAFKNITGMVIYPPEFSDA